MREVVFIDTWGFVAIADRRDEWRSAALECLRELQEARASLVTTNVVLYETYGLTRRRCTHDQTMEVVAWIDRSRTDGGLLTVVWVDEHLESAAHGIFSRYADKDFSFVDCLSFAVMREMGVQTAFTGDEHFRQMGFETLPQIER